MTDDDQHARLPAGHRPRRAPAGPRLDPAERPDPEHLRQQRELVASRRRGYAW